MHFASWYGREPVKTKEQTVWWFELEYPPQTWMFKCLVPISGAVLLGLECVALLEEACYV